MSTQQQCMVLNIPDWLKERKILLHYWVAQHEELEWRMEKWQWTKPDCRSSAGQEISRRLERFKKNKINVGSRHLYSGGWRRMRMEEEEGQQEVQVGSPQFWNISRTPESCSHTHFLPLFCFTCFLCYFFVLPDLDSYGFKTKTTSVGQIKINQTNMKQLVCCPGLFSLP